MAIDFDEESLAARYSVSFASDVLQDPDGRSEEELEDQLMADARGFGVSIADYAKPPLSPIPEVELSSSSSSVCEDKPAASLPRLDQHHRAMSSESSLSSFSGVQSLFDHTSSKEDMNESSTSIASTSVMSTHSSPIAALRGREETPKQSRRLKALSVLGISRPPSLAAMEGMCSRCPSGTPCNALHRLPCAHQYCTQALRELIKDSTGGENPVPPHCCNMQIPYHFFQIALTLEEQAALGHGVEGLDIVERSSTEDSRSNAHGRSRSQRSRSRSTHQRVDSLSPEEPAKEDAVVSTRQDDTLSALEAEHSAQIQRFEQWAHQLRDEKDARQATQREEMEIKLGMAKEQLEKDQDTLLATMEDKHLEAEAELRYEQEQEKCDVGTRLKYMEAYCAGKYANTGEAHGRTVTAQDISELGKARRKRAALTARHRGAVNVLRGEQGRKIQAKKRKLAEDIEDFDSEHAARKLEFERDCKKETKMLERFIESKRHSLARRSQVQLEVALRRSAIEAEQEANDAKDPADVDDAPAETEAEGEAETEAGEEAAPDEHSAKESGETEDETNDGDEDDDDNAWESEQSSESPDAQVHVSLNLDAAKPLSSDCDSLTDSDGASDSSLESSLEEEVKDQIEEQLGTLESNKAKILYAKAVRAVRIAEHEAAGGPALDEKKIKVVKKQSKKEKIIAEALA